MRLFLGKLDEDLDIIWINYFPNLANKHVWAYGVAETLDGGYMVCFTQDVLRDPDQQYIIDLHVLKTDTEGNLLMNVMLQDTFISIGSYGNLTLTDDGNFVVNGIVFNWEEPSNKFYNTLVHKFDSDGQIIWSRLMEWYPSFRSIGRHTALSDGRVAFAWSKDTTEFDMIHIKNEFPYVSALDSNGNLLWRYEWYDVSIRYIYRLITARNGDILGLGVQQKSSKGRTWVFRLSPDGDLLWQRHYSDSLQRPWAPNLEMFDITEMDDGRIAATGIVYDTNTLGYINPNIGLLVLDSMGCITPGCEGVLQYVTSTVDLPGTRHMLPVLSVTPNPASDRCYLSLPEGIPGKGGPYTLRVYDLQGVAIAEQPWTAGDDRLALDSVLWPSGMYRLLLFKGSSAVATGKVVITR